MTFFKDSSDWRNIPHGSDAALYKDGAFEAPPDAPERLELHRVRWITVIGDYRRAGIVDWEPGNEVFTPPGLRGYVRGRRGMNTRARIYTDRADAAEAVAALRDFGHGELLQYGGLMWWIATLDDLFETAEEIAADLAANWGAPEITADKIWADQFTDTGAVDISRLYGVW